MKVFVLAQEVGSNAPGILYERLLKALSERCTLDLAVAEYKGNESIKYRSLQTVRLPRMKHWMKRILTVLFKGDLVSRIKRRGIYFPEDADLILSLCSNDRFWALEAGEYWKKQSGKPWACYFVDAIPSPPEWVGNGPYRKSVEAIIRRCAKSMSFLGGLTEEMLEYEETMLPLSLKRGVFLPPVSESFVQSLPPPAKPPVFLYAGRIYGRRKAGPVLEAFSSLDFDARLVFAGTDRRVLKEIEAFAPHCKDKISLLEWTDDIEPLIAEATALLDIDAELENDVYLSSKLFVYLQYPRPIISVTGPGSPARRLLSEEPSVIVCPHKAEAIAEAMRRCAFESFDFSRRQSLLEEASASRIAEKMLQEFSAL